MNGSPAARGGPDRRQRGIGLIEVLVALVVVSLGVLGMAGLQLTGMKHSAGGFNRAKALLFAENMAVRMRLNGPGVAALAYAGFDTSTWGGNCDARPVPYCQASMIDGDVVAADSCSPVQLAGFDRWSLACGDWGGVDASGEAIGEGVVDALLDGRLQVSCDVATCTTYTIDVSWSEGSTTSGKPDAIDTRRVRMSLRP